MTNLSHLKAHRERTCADCAFSRGEMRHYYGVSDFVELMCHHPSNMRSETDPISGEQSTFVRSCRSVRLKPGAVGGWTADRPEDFNDCSLWLPKPPKEPGLFAKVAGWFA